MTDDKSIGDMTLRELREARRADRGEILVPLAEILIGAEVSYNNARWVVSGANGKGLREISVILRPTGESS